MNRIYVNYNMQCCGMREMSGLSLFGVPAEAMESFCDCIYLTEETLEKALAAVRVRALKDGKDAGGNGYFGIQLAHQEAGQMLSCNVIHTGAYQYSRFRFIVFTQATSRDSASDAKYYGDKFAAFITDNHLGTVTTAPREVNPNSGNYVTVFVWAINHDALKAWYGARTKKQKTINKMAQSILGGGLNPWANIAASSGTAPAPTATGNSGPAPWGYQNILDSAFVQRRQG